jgi:hypothetical protein
MKKHFLGFLVGLISLSVFAEKIDGPANIRTEPKGELSFSLYDKVEIECTEIKNDWYEISVTIKLTEVQYNTNPLIFEKGTKLYDMQGNEIGETLVDLRVGSKMTAGGAPGVPKWYASELYGFTFKSNIRPESIVEPVLTDLIKSNKSNLTLVVFKNHMIEFQYTDGLDIPDYDNLKTYMIYENAIDDPSPLDRIRLVFENDKLIAIIHSREINMPDFKTYEIERGRKLTIIKQFNDKERADFIEKNKQAYWGID